MKIEQWLIPVSNKYTRPGNRRTPLTITIHETGNTNKGANARSHARLQELGNARQASWHYQVDDGQTIYQSVPDNERSYAAGDGSGPGNTFSIHIEICVNSDGDFKKAVNNAVWLVRHLLAKYPHMTINDVVQHNKWSGKNCPMFLRNGSKGINWSQFINLVKAEPKKEEEVVEYERNAKPSPSLAKEFQEAIEAGLTDGTFPKRPATREELAVISLRVAKKYGTLKE